MLSKEKLARINELAKKKKVQGLSADETIEQQKLREEYLQAFRGGKKDCMADKDEFLFIPIEILKEIPYNMRCNKGKKNLN